MDGAPYIYLYTWIWIASLTVWTGFAWAVALELQARTAPRVRDVVRVASLGLVVLLCGWACVRAATLENPADSIPAANTAMATIIPQVEGAIPAGASVSIASSGSGIGHRAALAVALEETGHRFVVPPGEGYVYGSHRVGDPAATDTRLVIGLGSVVDKLEATAGLTRIASWNPLSTAERKESAQLSADLSAQLKAVGRADVVAKLATSEGLADLKTVKGLDRDQLSRLSQLVKAERTKVAVFEDTRPTSSS